MAAGSGLYAGPVDLLHIIAFGLLAFAAVAVAVGTVLTKHRRKITALLLAIAIVAFTGGAALSIESPPKVANASGILMGGHYDSSEGSIVITAGPGELFVYTVQIANKGMLPMRVLGIIKPPGVPANFPDWQSVTYRQDGDAGMLAVDDAQNLEPFDLEPGDFAQLNLVGRAGGCAAVTEEADSALSTTVVELAYEVVGLSSTTDIDLPIPITEPQKPGCAVL